VWSGAPQVTKLTVSAKATSRAQRQSITLRGFRPTGCGQFSMNDAVLCGDGKEESILGLTLVDEDNAAVPAGLYAGSFLIEAKGWHDRSFIEDLRFDYQITVER
jgi:hypothetical protein